MLQQSLLMMDCPIWIFKKGKKENGGKVEERETIGLILFVPSSSLPVVGWMRGEGGGPSNPPTFWPSVLLTPFHHKRRLRSRAESQSTPSTPAAFRRVQADGRVWVESNNAEFHIKRLRPVCFGWLLNVWYPLFFQPSSLLPSCVSSSPSCRYDCYCEQLNEWRVEESHSQMCVSTFPEMSFLKYLDAFLIIILTLLALPGKSRHETSNGSKSRTCSTDARKWTH